MEHRKSAAAAAESNAGRLQWHPAFSSAFQIELAKEYKGKEKNPLYETAMDVIMRANKEVYREAKGMCQALRELFAEELEERENKGMEKGMEQGESKLGMLISRLFADGRIGDARRAASDENLRRKYYQEYGMVN